MTIKTDISTGLIKRCRICGELKPLNEFYCRNGGTSKHQCKGCEEKRSREWRAKNPEKARESGRRWRAKNSEKYREIVRKCRAKNPEKYRENIRKWKSENIEKIRESERRRRAKNPEKQREMQRQTSKKKYSTPKGKLNRAISSAMYRSLKGNKSGRHWETLVDYTVYDLMKHLERLFKPGMSFENYGQWEIDHKIPLSVHNFQSSEDIDFKRAWALKNLQPLWSKDNIKKSNKLTKSFQPSFMF